VRVDGRDLKCDRAGCQDSLGIGRQKTAQGRRACDTGAGVRPTGGLGLIVVRGHSAFFGLRRLEIRLCDRGCEVVSGTLVDGGEE